MSVGVWVVTEGWGRPEHRALKCEDGLDRRRDILGVSGGLEPRASVGVRAAEKPGGFRALLSSQKALLFNQLRTVRSVRRGRGVGEGGGWGRGRAGEGEGRGGGGDGLEVRMDLLPCTTSLPPSLCLPLSLSPSPSVSLSLPPTPQPLLIQKLRSPQGTVLSPRTNPIRLLPMTKLGHVKSH